MANRSSRPHGLPTRGRLCFVCKNIDFERYLLEPLKTPIDLGTVSDIFNRSHCPFCDIVAHAFRVSLSPKQRLKLANHESWKFCVVKSEYDRWGLREFSNKQDLSSRDHRIAEITQSHAYQFIIVDGRDGSRTILARIQHLAAEGVPKIDRQFFGRRVEGFVNWNLLQSWLSACDRHHPDSCRGLSSKPLPLPRRLRFIDVWKKEIIPADHNQEYVALSYVWGSDFMGRPMIKLTKGIWESKHRIPLPRNLQNTIQDAIIATRELGYRYLWNDALCIIQDDEEDIKAQTDRMDAVYNRASLTIVAVSGNHADSGLPGVRSARRPCQHFRVVNGLRMANALTPFEHVVSMYRSDLAWNTRGWTLQEKVLSNRIMVFSNWQVYFRCCNAVWCEDIAVETGRLSNSIFRNPNPYIWPMNRPPGKRRAMVNGLMELGDALLTTSEQTSGFLNGFIHPLDLFNKDLKIYGSVIEEYTKRSLSVKTDILRAISGILRTFEASFGRFVAGMPVDFLDKALTWRPAPYARSIIDPTTRAPSWSWAGWNHNGGGCFWGNQDRWDEMIRAPMKDVFKWGHDKGGRNERVVSSTSFYKRFSYDSDPAPFIPSMSMWLLTDREEIPIWISKFGEPKKPREPPGAIIQTGRRMLRQVNTLLLFDTTIVKLRIRHIAFPDPRDTDIPPIYPVQADQLTLFELVDTRHRCIGEIWTTPAFVAQSQSKALPFVTLCWGGAPFEVVHVADYYNPLWVQLFGNDARKVGHPDGRTLCGSYWDLVNIILVERVDGKDGVWRRVAYGRVVVSAWFEAERENGWIIIV